MSRKYVSLSLAAAVLVLLVGASAIGREGQTLACDPCNGGVVDKAPGQAFMVEIKFKNTGSAEGTWAVNIAFEGEKWIWKGTAQNLTLRPCNAKTLTWNGTVPADAPIDSMARLVAYYNDSYTALNWWIHVVPDAELTIASSTVK